MVKIDIFSGFLGAGKTTLIKKLIAESFKGEKLVLIENEFGEIGVDAGFLEDAGIRITEMNSGCICCSLVGDFAAALNKVYAEYAPDRILIEPSGVGKLSDVIRAVKNANLPDAVINSATAVADANKVNMYMKNFGEFYNDQIKSANCIILSRTGNISEAKLHLCVAIIRGVNPDAIIITTPWDQLSGDKILAAMEKTDSLKTALEELEDEEICPVCGGHHGHHHHHDEEEHEHHHHHDDDDDDEDEHEHHHHDDDDDDEDEHEHEHHHHHDDDDDDEEEHEHHHHDGECGCGHHHDHDHHHHHADEVFTSWGVETAKKFDKDALVAAIKELDTGKYGTILRAKGYVEGTDGKWIYFDFVPEETDIRSGAPAVTGRLCVIGSKIDEDGIKDLFLK